MTRPPAEQPAEETPPSATLVGDRLRGGAGGLGVEVAAARLERAVVVAELVDQRLAGGDVEAGDVLVADAVEVLDDRAEAVAVGGEQDGAAGVEVGQHVGLPVG